MRRASSVIGRILVLKRSILSGGIVFIFTELPAHAFEANRANAVGDSSALVLLELPLLNAVDVVAP